MMLGVTLGIVVADAAVELLGASALVVSLVVLLSMWLALLATNGIMFVNQAGASAILVTTLHQPGIGGVRLIDALVGGVTALLFSQVLFPPDPVGVLLRAARDVLSVCAGALDRVVAAVHEERDSGDEDDEEPEWALEIARDVHDSLAALADARSTSFQIARLTRRRTVRPRLVAVGRRGAPPGPVGHPGLSMKPAAGRRMAAAAQA